MICEKIILDLIKWNCKIKLWTNRLERLCENAVHIIDITDVISKMPPSMYNYWWHVDSNRRIAIIIIIIINRLLMLLLTNLKTIKLIAWTGLTEILALVLSKLMCNRCK